MLTNKTCILIDDKSEMVGLCPFCENVCDIRDDYIDMNCRMECQKCYNVSLLCITPNYNKEGECIGTRVEYDIDKWHGCHRKKVLTSNEVNNVIIDTSKIFFYEANLILITDVIRNDHAYYDSDCQNPEDLECIDDKDFVKLPQTVFSYCDIEDETVPRSYEAGVAYKGYCPNCNKKYKSYMWDD